MDMRSIRENRGAVSIFLILVLVPCIAISCIFVDLARVELSKSMAESAADLALNSLLTNYDADLSEYYGLIGSVQNIEDFYDEAEAYFLRNIKSQGLSEDEIKLLNDSIKNLYDDSVVIDLLQTTDHTAEIKEVDNANLGTPALLKDSIVEFMKYRGPIEIASGIIKRIGESGFEELQDAQKNEPLKDAKEDFYEAEGELLKAAVYTYLAIQKYVNTVWPAEQGAKLYSNAQLVADENHIYSHKTVYAEMHNKAVSYLLNTGDLKQYYRPTFNISDYSNPNISQISRAYSTEEKDKNGTIYYINGNVYQSLIKEADDALTNFNTAMSNYASATRTLMNSNPQNNSSINALQWWVDMNSAVYGGNNVHNGIVNKGKDVLKAYSALLAAHDNCVEEPKPEELPEGYVDLPTTWKTDLNDKITALSNCYYSYLANNATGDNEYLTAAKALAKVSADNASKKNPNHYSFGVNGSSQNFGTALTTISNDLTNLYGFYLKVILRLDNIIDGIEPPKGEEQKTVSLDTLASMAKTYNSTFKTYDKEADKSANRGSKMGEDEVEVIDNLTLQEFIDDASVRELKTRLQNIRKQFETLKKEVENLTYGGIPLKDIKNFDTFKTCALTVVKTGEIPLNQNDINTKAKAWLASLLKPSDANATKLSNTNSLDHEPNLEENKPTLYAYMQENFKDLDEEKMNSTSEDEKKAKEALENYKTAAKDSATIYRGNADATITENTNNPFKAEDILGSSVELLKTLTGDNGLASIRDDMYVTTYIMEMFSYATFDREAMYKNMTDEHKKNMIPSDVSEAKNSKGEYDKAADNKYFKDNGYYGDETGDLSAQRKTWVSSAPQDTYNKSLTNKMINNANNQVYLGEVEYLLYGNASPEANLKEAYASIYGLRFTLNSISGYHHFWGWSNNTGVAINNAASLISGFFGGVVPPAAFKILMIPMLAAMETCNDNARLYAGMPVELYKAQADKWWYSFESSAGIESISGFLDSLFKLASGEGASVMREKNQDEGFFYSDYMTLFVYCALTNNEGDTYSRLGNLIAANMKRLTKTDYDLAKTRMYFQLEADLRVKPLMVTIPYYLDEYDNNLPTATDWCTIKDLIVVRGYS